MAPARKRTPRDGVDEVLGQWSRERPDLDASGLGVVLRISLLAGRFADQLKAILAPAGLAPFEYDVLSALRRSGEGAGVSPTELWRAAELTSGAMTHRLDRLEERKLVKRRKAPDDRRGIRVFLTSRGRELVDGIVADRMAAATDALGPLTRNEARELSRLLRVLGSAADGSGDASS